jgi:hypothetical protein
MIRSIDGIFPFAESSNALSVGPPLSSGTVAIIAEFENDSVIRGIPEAPIVEKVWISAQIANGLDREGLNGWQTVYALHSEMDGEIRGSCIGVSHLRAVCAGSVAEIPEIVDRRHSCKF